jgi:4'-phosphopantetheinyl transferase
MNNGPDLLVALQSELHVWTARPIDINAKQLIPRYLLQMDTEEYERYKSFRSDVDRLQYLSAHALLRQVLSNYAPYRPEQWRFLRGPHGKPEIALVPGMPPLHFNLSHTRGMVACIVGYDCVCGIDVEEIQPNKDLRSVAPTIFSEAELSYLDAQDEATWLQHFFTLWTLKEAYVKAIGLGLSVPLRQISFYFDASQTSVKFANMQDEKSANWLFHHFKPTASHQLAIAVNLHVPIANIICRDFRL